MTGPSRDTGDHPPALIPAPIRAAILDLVAEAQARGFLGADLDLDRAVAHAHGFCPPIVDARRVLDLGSGGGLPGLVVAAALPGSGVTLLDASVRRTDWLRRAVNRLGWSDRVAVVTGRAEVLAHEPRWRGSQDAVVARSFAPALITAECAAPLLRPGGRLVVSEPPSPRHPGRWPDGALAGVGLTVVPWHDAAYAVLARTLPCPDIVPRAKLVRRNTS
ncbi:MAG TPA: RsmG family class I SAM-dependent methyltransferase [Acidimicrobiales bacterium]|nr:RsmG family class I SAM-dependent methyltransferase [Acidimicrobiales bacterium]